MTRLPPKLSLKIVVDLQLLPPFELLLCTLRESRPDTLRISGPQRLDVADHRGLGRARRILRRPTPLHEQNDDCRHNDKRSENGTDQDNEPCRLLHPVPRF